MEEDELITSASSRDYISQLICKKTDELRELADPDGLKPLLFAGEPLRKDQENPEERLTEMILKHIFRYDGIGKSLEHSAETKIKLKKLVNEIKDTKRLVLDIHKNLKDWQDNLQRYNVPRISSDKELDTLKDFMKVWKEEAETGRRNKWKTLLELLDLCDCEQMKTTSKSVKITATFLGIQISEFFMDFYLLCAVSTKSQHEIMRKIHQFEVILEGLTVEANSIIIKKFVEVVKFLGQTLRMAETYVDMMLIDYVYVFIERYVGSSVVLR